MRSGWRETSCLVSFFNRDAVLGGLEADLLSGLYEFVKKGDPPVMGVTKLKDGITEAYLKNPRKKLALEETAAKLPSTTPGSLPASATALPAASTTSSPAPA
jgi:hypothetical protein